MSGKYDKLFPIRSDQEKNRLKTIILNNAKKMEKKDPRTLSGYYFDCDAAGMDPWDTCFIGPFTARDFLAKIGIHADDYKDMGRDEKRRILQALDESRGLLKIDFEKEAYGFSTLVKVHTSAEAKKEMAKLKEVDGKFKLNKWDKFCAFFRIKTEHALSVEMNLAGLEVYKERQKTLAKEFAVKQLADECNTFLSKHKKTYENQKKKMNVANEKAVAWRKIFFGAETKDNEVPYYVFEGKKISALSLCIAAFQQRNKIDISIIDPEAFAESLDNPANAKAKAIIEEISYKHD